MEEPWTILELVEVAAETLAAAEPVEPSATATPSGTPAPAGTAWGTALPAGAPSGPVRGNGRVRDVPNERLVRWYVTVGLVDPPLSRRGRVAQYGRRHLLQLVAIKRRQAEGRSLAQIQAELAGATDDKLAAVARVPDTRPAPETPAAASGRFWARQPGQPESAAAGRLGQVDLAAAAEPPGQLRAADKRGPWPVADRVGRPVTAAVQGDPADRRVGLVHGVRLAPGVTLLLEDADHEPGPDEVAGIVNAAGLLLAELASRRLRADHVE